MSICTSSTSLDQKIYLFTKYFVPHTPWWLLDMIFNRANLFGVDDKIHVTLVEWYMPITAQMIILPIISNDVSHMHTLFKLVNYVHKYKNALQESSSLFLAKIVKACIHLHFCNFLDNKR